MNTATSMPAAVWRSWVTPLLALAVFVAVLVVIHRELEHFHLRDVIAYLRAIPPMNPDLRNSSISDSST